MPDARIQLETYLHDSLGPAPLLRLEGINLDRNFRRRLFIKQVDEFPTHQLSAEAEVRILSQRVVLPATAHFDGVSAPDAGGAIEIEEGAGAIAGGLFDDEVAVEHDGLQSRQQVVTAVDMRPAH